MKALVLHGDRDLRYENFEDPKVTPENVKVKVHACGVCGSDIPRIMHGKAHYYPIVLGHEFAGEIVEKGENVKGIEIGDHVVGVPLVPCMNCSDCKDGHPSQCKNYTFIGSRIQGGFADYVVLPATNVVRVDNAIPYKLAAFIEPATVAYHGISLLGFEKGKNVAILGGGTVGLFVLQWVKLLGAEKVAVFGRDKQHLSLAEKLGADAVYSTEEVGYFEESKLYTNGHGFDYVYETAGAIETLKKSFEIAANQAKVTLIGTPTRAITFEQNEWELINRKEFVLTGSWMSGGIPYPGDDWKYTAECLSNGKITVSPEMIAKEIEFSKPDILIEELSNAKRKKGRFMLLNT